MKKQELIDKLNDIHQTPRGNKIAKLHLFGIKYSEYFLDDAFLQEVVRTSDLNGSYLTEIRKGKKLADYVDIKSSAENLV